MQGRGHGHPKFVRACHGVDVEQGHRERVGEREQHDRVAFAQYRIAHADAYDVLADADANADDLIADADTNHLQPDAGAYDDLADTSAYNHIADASALDQHRNGYSDGHGIIRGDRSRPATGTPGFRRN